MAKTATAAKKTAPKKAEAPPKPDLKVVVDDRPACRTCPYWQQRAAHGNLCKRFPHSVIKGADDWCGEHPHFDVRNSQEQTGIQVQLLP